MPYTIHDELEDMESFGPNYGYTYEDEIEFANPGGNSALRAGNKEFPCPTCHRENMLTAADVQLGYQCDMCADAAEYGGGY